ncbi:MAG: winged helix-turn-helix domain-containing protein [Pseudomonadota bacterium]
MVNLEQPFRLGDDVIVHPSQSRLDLPSGPQHVEPKVMAVLQRLAREPGEVVKRQTLLDDVWTGTVVTDEVVTRCISELRHALGDSAKAPRYVQTLPKRGYRLLETPRPLAVNEGRKRKTNPLAALAAAALLVVFVAGVYWVRPQGQSIAAQNVVAQEDPALAVLAFDNLDDGSDPAAGYFGAGLAEELVNALVQVPGLRVASRAAVAEASGDTDVTKIARKLGVTTVLRGSVRKFDDRIRVNAQLVDGSDGFHIWAEQFERPLTDLFAIQDEIAAAIVGALKLELTQPVRVARLSSDMAAYDYYLLGRHHWHQRTAQSLERAAHFFKQAIDTDPNMAIAYSGLGDTYLLQTDYGGLDREAASGSAEPLVKKALELNPDLPEAHASLGILHLYRDENDKAEAALREAVRLNPNNQMALMWLGSAVAHTGNVKEAHGFYTRAYELDPMHPVAAQNTAISYATIGEYEEAWTVLENLDDEARARKSKLWMASELGEFSEVRYLAESAMAQTEEKTRYSAYHALWTMHARRGETEEAERILADARADGQLVHDFAAEAAFHYAASGNGPVVRALLADLRTHAPKPMSVSAVATAEGLLALTEERYDEAAEQFELALRRVPEKVDPSLTLYMASHLLHAYKQQGDNQRVKYWRERGERMIEAARSRGHGSFSFLLESGFFYAACGQVQRAADTFWESLLLGRIAPWELTEDARVAGVLKEQALEPILSEAARRWAA